MDKNEVKTVLIADDEESVREIVKIHLENQGYNVITSENGEEAIDALKENDISLAITDLKMPKVDGFGVLDFIKKNYDFIPAIVLTGYVDVDLAVEAMKKGCFDYITKPIKKDEFIEIVGNALKKHGHKLEHKDFEISGLYLLNEAGVLIYHNDFGFHPKFDEDMFGSMFTAVKAFIRDSLRSDERLSYIEHGSLKIMVEECEDFFLVVVGQGEVMEPVKRKMKRIASNITKKYGEAIANWSGNLNIFDGIDREFDILI